MPTEAIAGPDTAGKFDDLSYEELVDLCQNLGEMTTGDLVDLLGAIQDQTRQIVAQLVQPRRTPVEVPA